MTDQHRPTLSDSFEIRMSQTLRTYAAQAAGAPAEAAIARALADRGNMRRRPLQDLGGWRLLLVAGVLLLAMAIGVGEVVNRLVPPVRPSPTPAPTVQPTPLTTPEATPTTAPTATLAPTVPPAPALLDRTWELGNLPSVATAAVSAFPGWFALGDGCGGGCDSFDITALTSADGITWTEHLLPDGDEYYPVNIAWTGDRLVALGEMITEVENGTTAMSSARIWMSGDGTSWSTLSTIDLGPCDEDRCLQAQTFAVSDDGVMVVGASDRGTGSTRAVFRSQNGTSWTEAAPGTFGTAGPPFSVIEVIAVSQTLFLAGACDGCPISLWSSTDGIDWTSLGAVTGPTPSHVEMASDDERLVVAQEHCVREPEAEDTTCTMSLWSGMVGGPVTQVAPEIQVRSPRLEFMDGAIFLAGMSTDERPRVFASVDSVTWAEQPTTLDFAGCAVADLIAGVDELLLLTSADCGMVWVGHGKP